MSTTPDGSYKLVDLPANGTVPELTAPMLAWLRDHDYVEHAQLALPNARTIRRLASQSEAKPNMSAVPKGQRNTVLHNWALGRYINHPENRTAIHDDLMERAQSVGCPNPRRKPSGGPSSTTWETDHHHGVSQPPLVVL